MVGTGTMILSKWPIVETNFRQFSMNGFKHEIWYGDALAGSGIGMAKVKIGQDLDAFWVNVFVSHYHAEYDRYLSSILYLKYIFKKNNNLNLSFSQTIFLMGMTAGVPNLGYIINIKI